VPPPNAAATRSVICAARVPHSTTVKGLSRLQKALWQNVAELRLAEARRHRYMRLSLIVLSAGVLLALTAAG
jgi:hypothetical protein